MPIKRQLIKTIKKSSRKFRKKYLLPIKKQIIWLLRTFFVNRSKRSTVNAGFVLPTVAMVALVVVLLTTAILFRSFERAKNASNVRVNEAVIQAATPALERAKAKITELFSDPTLPRSVPSNATLYSTLTSKLTTYTLGDETPIILAYDINANNSLEASSTTTLENREKLETAWKFPVDTDNNGKFDSFILYGIYFRNAPQNGTNPTRKRSPLDARTPPMLPAKAGGACDVAGNTSASLVGSSGWYKLPTGELKKSFFVYTVTVPITNKGSLDSKYEQYKGNRGFSALELQQDRSQLPITNNAVVYEDDLEIYPGPRFRLNGRIFTNSNLLMEKTSSNITLFQVSSPQSCYYERENGKIIVGGNLAGGYAINDTDTNGIQIDLFVENGTPTSSTLASTNKSTSNQPNQIAYNSQAYAQRIDLLVTAQLANGETTDPQEVKDNKSKRITNDPTLDANKVRKEELEVYFRKRTRRVPFKEVNYGVSGVGTFTTADVLQGYNSTGSSNSLRPPDAWVYPTNTNTTLTLDTDQLPAKDPDTVVTETEFGDRIILGNNLPELRWDSTKGKFLDEDDPQDITGKTWTGSTKTRTRKTNVRQLADLGFTGRDGFWEIAAASPRSNALDVVGGLRVITGAGIYRRTGSFMTGTAAPPTATDNPSTTENEAAAPVVWPDTMPMLGYEGNDTTKPLLRGDLVMRATAVYHYNNNAYEPQKTIPKYYQTPIACISSYYNPTNQTTATTNTYNPLDSTTAAASNNGITYVPSTTSASITRGQTVDSNGLFTPATAGSDNVTDESIPLLDRLKYQANLVFPNGRFVNPLLRQALKKATTSNLTLSEQAALDSTICAIEIADATPLTRDATPVIPDGTIKETTLLDGRQIQAIDDSTSPTGLYNLQIEQRQPLEIRATVIDLNLLRTKSISGTWTSGEYLLPNSGIIYATRDDAQPDQTGSTVNVSASDYKLDPARRPNAIMLINGSNISRETNYRAEEKGLILATDLPVYVKGNFNLHGKQEFKSPDNLTTSNFDTKFYARLATNRDPDFACRPNDPRLSNCTAGETWRPASVIADAVTLVSSNFREGFRNEGDYDLRNNQGTTASKDARLKNGFWENNFVTSRNFDNAYYSSGPGDSTNDFNNSTRLNPNPNNSSYFNNFVTPIQRRGNFPEYVMEMCFKLPVSECGASDWYVGYDADANNNITSAESKVLSSALPKDAVTGNIVALVGNLVAGTTAKPAKSGYERFARRVAFLRNSSGQLVKPDGTTLLNLASERPVALGIKLGIVSKDATIPDAIDNALWFTTTTDTANPPANTTKVSYDKSNLLFYKFPTGADATYQPLLEPVMQLQVTKAAPPTAATNNYSGLAGTDVVDGTRWLSRATTTTFNLIIAAGDTPSRVGNTTNPTYEANGGLHNFPRFLENWDSVDNNINGSFIQFKRSIYATGPYQALVRSTSTANPTARTIFTRTLSGSKPGYNSDSTPKGEAPYYMPPNRIWGFDVALLAQNPDLFAQRFVIPATDPPNEYYREVGKDDLWVQTLLCAFQTQTSDGFDTPDSTYFGSSLKFALPATERPSNCKLKSS